MMLPQTATPAIRPSALYEEAPPTLETDIDRITERLLHHLPAVRG